jgi:hypothetical protein
MPAVRGAPGTPGRKVLPCGCLGGPAKEGLDIRKRERYIFSTI